MSYLTTLNTIVNTFEVHGYHEPAEKLKDAIRLSFDDTERIVQAGIILMEVKHQNELYNVAGTSIEEYFNYCRSIGVIF